jgi:hypothetical protein
MLIPQTELTRDPFEARGCVAESFLIAQEGTLDTQDWLSLLDVQPGKIT